VILPRDNELNTTDLPPEVRADTQFLYVDRIEEALADALFRTSGAAAQEGHEHAGDGPRLEPRARRSAVRAHGGEHRPRSKRA
jgi:hypothetical protein